MTTESPSNTYTLADLARATRKRLGPTKFIIGEDLEVELPSVFRLPKKTREAVWKAMEDMDKLSDEDGDELESYQLLVEAISDVLRLITPKADLLLDAVGSEDPLESATLLGEILGKWMENTQAGEA